MEYDFYFADLDWHVTIEDGKSGVLKNLAGYEKQVLSLSLWHALSGFLTHRALYLTGQVDESQAEGSGNGDNDNVPGGG